MSEETNDTQSKSAKDWWEAQSAENKRKWGVVSLGAVALLMLVIAMGGVSFDSAQRSQRTDNPAPVDPYLFGGGRSNIQAIEDLDRSLRRFGERLTEMEADQQKALERLERTRENFEEWVETTDIERLTMRARRRMQEVEEKISQMEENVENKEFAQAGIQRLDLDDAPESAADEEDASDQGEQGETETAQAPERPEPPSPQPEPNPNAAPQDLFSGTGMTPRSASNQQAEPEDEPRPRTGLRINGRSVSQIESAQTSAQATEQSDGAEQAEARPTPAEGRAEGRAVDRIDDNIPVGSIVSAVLIHGMDAPTGTGSRGEPVPTIARITDLSILPNMQSMDLVDCHILIAAYGDLSSERAMGRTEDLSCTTADGEIIHTQLQGYIVGPDGKVGVRGPVIHRNGELVVRSVQSGVLSGLGQMFGGRRQGLAISTTGRLAEQDLGDAAQEGIGKGVGTALQNISEYYLELAESIFPVINVDAGTPVDIVITGQADLGR